MSLAIGLYTNTKEKKEESLPSPPSSQPVPPRMKFTGKKNLLPNGRGGFFTQVQRLCTEAALTGLIRIKVLKRFYGPGAHKRSPGLHVTAPQPQGIPLIWQESSDSLIRMMLGVPEGTVPNELCTTFKDILDRWAGKAKPQSQEEEEEEMKQSESGMSPTLARILEAEDGPKPPGPTADESRPDESPPKATSADSPGGRSDTAFIRDETSVELFLREMATYADPNGDFATSDAVEVLRAQFGFPRVERKQDRQGYNLPYNALARLAQLGTLEKPDSYGYRIPADTLRRLREEGVVSDQPPGQPPAQPAPTGAEAPEEVTSLPGSPRPRFYRSSETIERFLLGIVQWAGPRGEFTTSQAVELLRSDFGFPRTVSNDVYNVLHRLAKSGVFEKLEEGYRIPEATLERLKRAAAQEQAGTPDAEPSRGSAGLDTQAELERTEKLLREAEEVIGSIMAKLRSRRLELAQKRSERDAIPAQIAELQRRQETLEGDIADLTAAVNDPRVLGIEQSFLRLKARMDNQE
jgi:hypothetical protein